MKKLLLGMVLFCTLSHASLITAAEKLTSFQLPNQNGVLVKSQDFIGKQPTYLILWASW